MVKGSDSLPLLVQIPTPTLVRMPTSLASAKKKRLRSSKSSGNISPLPAISNRKTKKTKIKLLELVKSSSNVQAKRPLVRPKKNNIDKIRTLRNSRVSRLTHIAEHLGDVGPATKENREELLKFWVGCLSLFSRSHFFQIMSKPNDLNSSAALALTQRKVKAACYIVKFLRHKSNWFFRRIERRVKLLHKHGWRLLLFWRCYKRKKAILLLRTLFADFSPFRLVYVMLRYRANAVHLQRYVRSYVDVTKGRVEALLKRWGAIEADLRMTLIPPLLKVIETEMAVKKREVENNCQWKNVRLNGIVFPQLAEKVNSATYTTAKLRDKMITGEKKMSSLQQSLAKARAEQTDPAAEERKRRRRQLAALQAEQKNEQSAPARKKAPKKMTQGTRDKTIELGLHPNPPLSNRAREKLCYNFLHDIRRTYREIERERQIIANHKKAKGLSLDDVKQILSSASAEREFAEHIINQEVRSRKFSIYLYTGQAAEQFKDLVERQLKIEHGIPTDKYL